MNPTTLTKNLGNIDLFMNSQIIIPISTTSHINHTQKSIRQSILPIDFIFIGDLIIDTKKTET